MNRPQQPCPDCESEALGQQPHSVNRRRFLQSVGAGAAAAALAGGLAPSLALAADEQPKVTAGTPESLAKVLFDSLSEAQRKELCFAWDYVDETQKRGLLRTRISNNWHITKPVINSDYFNSDQQHLVRAIWEGIIHPDWQERVDKQLQDDAGGFGNSQNIAFFGTPGDGKYELVMTGRHMTLRVDGDSADHVAFGGPIFYGHAASGFNEKPGHPNNVYWEMALAANRVYAMLDGSQRAKAEVAEHPREQAVAFQGAFGNFPGIPVAEMSDDQKEELQKVLQKLIEPYRQSDRDEVVACLKAQGGLDKCSLAFYTADDLGGDKVWDSWRLEGPSFVWYFRGTPHVHVWVNIASDPAVELNA